MIRSHEVKQEGYEVQHDGKVITIFSAPNYCDFTGNKAAFIKLKGNEMKAKFTQFDAVVIFLFILSHIQTSAQWLMPTNSEECTESMYSNVFCLSLLTFYL